MSESMVPTSRSRKSVRGRRKPNAAPRRKVVFRAHDWIDIKTCKAIKSVQARYVGERKWMNMVGADNKPTFFKTEKQRQRALVSLEMRELVRRLAAKDATP